MARLERHQEGKQVGHDEKLAKLRNEFDRVSKERQEIQAKIDENNQVISQTDDKVLL